MVINANRFPALYLKFNWEGWEATTHELQRRGWEILVEADIHRFVRNIYLKNKQFQVYGRAESIGEDFLENIAGSRELITLRIISMSADVVIKTHSMGSPSTFSMMAELTSEIAYHQQYDSEYSIREIFKYFSKPNYIIQPPQEIIVPEKNVDELLEQILDLQKPQRQEYIQRKVKEGIPAIKTTHASIISLAI